MLARQSVFAVFLQETQLIQRSLQRYQLKMVVMSRGKGFIYDVFSELINLTLAAIYLLVIVVDNGTRVEIGNSILDFQLMGLYQVSGFPVLCMGTLYMISNRG